MGAPRRISMAERSRVVAPVAGRMAAVAVPVVPHRGSASPWSSPAEQMSTATRGDG